MAVLIQIVIGLVIVGLVLWAVQQIPMDPAIARIIRVVIIVCVVVWLLYYLASFLGGLPALPPPRAVK
jgi:predicted secreted protein